MQVQLVSLESPLVLAEALAILVKLGLELSQLCKLHGLVILRRGVHLPVVPRCPGIFPHCGGSTTRAVSYVSSIVATSPSRLKHSLVGS